MDSLQALQIRTQICKDLDLGGNGRLLNQNVVFETANIHNLAQVLYRLSHNQELEMTNPVEAMSQMIQMYTSFQRYVPGLVASSKQHLVVRQFPRGCSHQLTTPRSSSLELLVQLAHIFSPNFSTKVELKQCSVWSEVKTPPYGFTIQ